MEQKSIKQSANNRPQKKFRAGAISATVWNNIVDSIDGDVKEFKTISFERNYKDREGNWKSTNQLRAVDIPKATLVLNKAFEYVSLSDMEEK